MAFELRPGLLVNAERGIRRLTILLGLSVVLAACSATTARTDNVDADRVSARSQTSPGSTSDAARGSVSRRRESVVGIAAEQLGAPYRWGGSSPEGFDCSGFVQYVYRHIGVSLPHNAARQYQYGAPVSRDQLEPGDLVFFDQLRHNGIYVGQGRFIHARRSGKHVSISNLDESWYAARWVGARRL